MNWSFYFSFLTFDLEMVSCSLKHLKSAYIIVYAGYCFDLVYGVITAFHSCCLSHHVMEGSNYWGYGYKTQYSYPRSRLITWRRPEVKFGRNVVKEETTQKLPRWGEKVRNKKKLILRLRNLISKWFQLKYSPMIRETEVQSKVMSYFKMVLDTYLLNTQGSYQG